MPAFSKTKISCIVMMSPSMPVISEMLVTLRVPSLRRVCCTTIWIAEAICWRIARSGRLVAPIAIIVSMRDSASRGVLAWTVVSDPSWPVFIACSMSSASSPRTSPTTMRSGRIRRALIDELALADGALAFDVRRPRLEPRHVLLAKLQFGGVLDRDDALAIGDEARTAR